MMEVVTSSGDSHVTFARALASPDKEIRDKTLKSLINYASSLQEISELEMLKLWKALYYCMWLSDKAVIQQELAGSISELFKSFKKTNIALLYYRMFYRTMIREWSLLDQHRINKFYYLIRLMLREGLSSMHKQSWSDESVYGIMDILEEEVLIKLPNGLRLHMSDIFLQELHVASQGDIDTGSFLRVLGPFFRASQGAADSSFQDRVNKKVFSEFIRTFAREHSTENDAENGERRFLDVDSKEIQGMLFSLASDEDTPEKNRRKLYLLHQEFPAVTGEEFVETEEMDVEEEEVEEEEEVVKTNATSKSTEKKKKKLNSDDSDKIEKKTKKETLVEKVAVEKKVEEEKAKKVVPAVDEEILKKKKNADKVEKEVEKEVAVTTSEAVAEKKKEKKKEKRGREDFEGTSVDDEKVEKEAEKEVEVVSKKMRRDKSVVAEVEKEKSSEKGTEKGKGKEKEKEIIADGKSKGVIGNEDEKPVSKSTVTPATTPVAAVKVVAVVTPAVLAPFISSKFFSGAKANYVFKKGSSGVGYYTDVVLMKKQAKLDKIKADKVSKENGMKGEGGDGVTVDKNAEKKLRKKEKKEKDRRMSGSYPLANSVRVDDLTPLEGEADKESAEVEVKVDKKVRFGKPQSLEYRDSINSLKSNPSPSHSSPHHSALKESSGFKESGGSKVQLKAPGSAGRTPGGKAARQKASSYF